MKIFLTSIKRVTSLDPERFHVTVSVFEPENEHSSEIAITVELGTEAMNLTISQIEEYAIDKAQEIMGQLSRNQTAS
jgi:hypothetical protein